MVLMLSVQFEEAASATAGTIVYGSVFNLSQNPSQSLATIQLPAGIMITKAYVAATPSTGNLAFSIVSENGGKIALGTETTLTQTTVFNPNTVKAIRILGGTYSFQAVLTQTNGSTAVTVTLYLEAT